ncbi:N-6 DNA methylase [Nocardiopsis sp. NPDC057823]|uniref:N-6 DNA methylase n=1 Tax=Nocardiopsis sp. NPDC057823 TaxID=3346256 RepID=UPI00366E2AF9
MDTGDVEVTSADIARIAGVKPTAVSNWRRRHDDFPRPVGGTDRSPRFDLAAVERWLSAHRGAPSIDPDQRLWQAVDSLRSSMPAESALAWVGILLLHLHRHGTPAAGAADPDALFDAARTGFAASLADAGLEHLVGPDSPPRAQLPVLADAAVRAARGSSPATAFERLLAHLDQRAPSGSHTLPPALADLMVRLAGPAAGDGAVADPACGRGELLLAAGRAGHSPLHGQDRDAPSARLAALRAGFAGLLDHRLHLVVGDALRSPAPPAGGAGTVLCAPPFGERNWGTEDLVEDERWVYGIPPRLESDLAWAQHCLALARPGGSVVMVMPPGAAARPSGRRIRRELLRAGVFRAVISLPPGLAAHYAVPLQLWVLRRPEPGRAPGPVLLADTSPHDPGAPADEASVVDRVDRLWRAFLADPDAVAEPGVARGVDVVDLLDEDVDLTPRPRLPVPRGAAVDLETFARDRRRVESALRALRTLVPRPPGEEPGAEPTRVVTLAELAKAGSVTIRRPAARRTDRDHRTGDARTTARVISGEDVARGRPASGTEEVDADPMRNPPVQEGDVLIPAVAARPVARVATAADAGAYPGPGLYVVRTNPGAVDPWFLAGFVTSTAESRTIARVGSSTRGSLRVDPARTRLPVLPVEEQRRHGEMFRQVARFRDALHELDALGQDLADRSVDLIAGRWAPAPPAH